MIYTDCPTCGGEGMRLHACPTREGQEFTPVDLAGMHIEITEAIEGARMWALVVEMNTDAMDKRVEESAAMADAVIACLTADRSPASKEETT